MLINRDCPTLLVSTLPSFSQFLPKKGILLLRKVLPKNIRLKDLMFLSSAANDAEVSVGTEKLSNIVNYDGLRASSDASIGPAKYQE